MAIKIGNTIGLQKEINRCRKCIVEVECEVIIYYLAKRTHQLAKSSGNYTLLVRTNRASSKSDLERK